MHLIGDDNVPFLRCVVQMRTQSEDKKAKDILNKFQEVAKNQRYFYLETYDVFQDILKFNQWIGSTEATFTEKIKKLDEFPNLLYYAGICAI